MGNKIDPETGLSDPDFSNVVQNQTKKWFQEQLETSDFTGYDMMRCKFHLEDEEGMEAADCAKQSCYRMGFTFWSIVKLSVVQSYPEWRNLNINVGAFDQDNPFADDGRDKKQKYIGNPIAANNFSKLQQQIKETKKLSIIE